MSTDEIKIKTFIEYQLSRFNDTGNHVVSNNILWVRDPNTPQERFVQREFIYSHAVGKIIDEVLTNAIDSYQNNKVIGRIDIVYEAPYITITNWGRHIGFNDVITCFSREYSSSNYNDEDDNIKGGINGLGVKLTNILSRSFNVESCDGTQIYSVTFSENMYKTGEAKITKAAVPGKPYVRVYFEPDYDRLCMITKNKAPTNWIGVDKNAQIIDALLLRRAHEIATYGSIAECFGGRTIPVYYCGTQILSNIEQFAQRHRINDGDKILRYRFNCKWPCHIVVIVHEPHYTGEEYKPVGFRSITMINGVMLADLSPLVKGLIKQLQTYVNNHRDIEKFTGIAYNKDKKKKFPESLIYKNMTFITIMQYPTKCFTFTGQVKSSITFDNESNKYISKNYIFDDEFCEKYWLALSQVIIRYLKPKNKGEKFNMKLYVPAIGATKNCRADALLVTEGDSASTLMKFIVNTNKKMGAHKYGIITTGGVPMNALKNSRLMPSGYQQNDNLRSNDGLQSIVRALGLNPDNQSIVPRYRSLILCTDQDFDGIGKICSLIICFFMIYFPNLVQSGFIKRYRTPIIRVKTGNKIINFYSEQAFEEYCVENPGTVGVYYKGLGVHDARERRTMALSFFDDVINIRYDRAGEMLMHILYGESTLERKYELLRFDENAIRRYENDLNITLYEHMINEALAEQNNNIKRMTPDVRDALVSVHRKILHLLRSKKKYEKMITASALTGIVKGTLKYDHAEAAMEGAIKRLAQSFIGSNWFPLILGWSASNGSRDGGKKETASGRYTNVIANPFTNYYYPVEDDSLIPRVVEEGVSCEPTFYVSIIPRILLETSKCVATGWNSNLVGRDYETTIKYVRASIRAYPYIICTNMFGQVQIVPDMKIIKYDGKEICLGAYRIERITYDISNYDCVMVYQLPIGMSAKKYIKILTPKIGKGIVQIINNSADHIDIKIIVDHGLLERIKHSGDSTTQDTIQRRKIYLDPIIEYFNIYSIFSCNLNFYYIDRLVEYDNIHDIFKDWFVARRELYIKRIEKRRAYLDIQIKIQENIYYFLLNNHVDLIVKKPKKICDEILASQPVEYLVGNARNGTNIRYDAYEKFNIAQVSFAVIGTAQDLINRVASGATYQYIYNVKISRVQDEKIEKQRLAICALYDQYDEALRENWDTTWLSELDRLDRLYRYGTEKKWYWEDILSYKV